MGAAWHPSEFGKIPESLNEENGLQAAAEERMSRQVGHDLSDLAVMKMLHRIVFRILCGYSA